ncbi:hypothetical protein vseg_006168 [Gypsophila vaccaria]
MRKADVKSVPAWIQFHQLSLKFWGKSLPKITGIIRKYIKSDAGTEQRMKLGYARVMVELVVDHKCPEKVSFKDEMGEVIQVGVDYKWKPITCANCRAMGHQQEHYRKGEPQKLQLKAKKVWRPMVKPVEEIHKPEGPGKEVIIPTTPNQAKKLVQLHRDKGTDGQEGYSTIYFGSLSYREVLSPNVKVVNGNVKPPNISHG